MVPVIETQRLRLRGHTLADFEVMVEVWGDPGTTRFTIGRPATLEETWGRLHRYAGHWALMGFGYWAWEEKASGRFVGEGGFSDFKRAVEPALDAPEHGWVLAPWAYGQGFALEALKAHIAWAETHFKRSDFVCMIAPENERSIKLAEKVGYREFTRAEYKGEPELILRRA
jgi:RimJ/RimL family protein N-acetyltransferase